ncbi:MAG: ABC transporter permease, partial [Micromonosporaceae bacterium]
MHRRTGTAERPRPDSSAKRAPTTAGTGKPAPAIAAATPERRCAPCRRLAASLAVIGIAVLGQFIVVSARRRRRDFAVLKALGLLRRQVRSITAWQVSTVTGLAVLAGLPPGVAA